MAQVSPEELLERLERGKAIPAVLLLGEEPYLRDECRKQLIERFVPEPARTWAVSRYSAGRGGTQAALDQAQTMARLSPNKSFSSKTPKLSKSSERKTGTRPWRKWALPRKSRAVHRAGARSNRTGSKDEMGKLLAEKTLVVSCGLGDNPGDRQAAAVAFARTIAKKNAWSLRRARRRI